MTLNFCIQINSCYSLLELALQVVTCVPLGHSVTVGTVGSVASRTSVAGIYLVTPQNTLLGLGVLLFTRRLAVKFRKMAFLFPHKDPCIHVQVITKFILTLKGSPGDTHLPLHSHQWF